MFSFINFTELLYVCEAHGDFVEGVTALLVEKRKPSVRFPAGSFYASCSGGVLLVENVPLSATKHQILGAASK